MGFTPVSWYCLGLHGNTNADLRGFLDAKQAITSSSLPPRATYPLHFWLFHFSGFLAILSLISLSQLWILPLTLCPSSYFLLLISYILFQLLCALLISLYFLIHFAFGFSLCILLQDQSCSTYCAFFLLFKPFQSATISSSLYFYFFLLLCVLILPLCLSTDFIPFFSFYVLMTALCSSTCFMFSFQFSLENDAES